MLLCLLQHKQKGNSYLLQQEPTTYYLPKGFSGGTCSHLTCSDNQSALVQPFFSNSKPSSNTDHFERARAKVEEKLLEQSSASRSAADARVETLRFQGPAVCLEIMVPHPPALSHDPLAEVIKKNKPKPAHVKSTRTELCRVFLQEGKAKIENWRNVQKQTWCQEWIQWSNRLRRLRHQRIQVHQSSIGAQKRLGGFPSCTLFAWCHAWVLGIKEIRTCGTAMLRWQSGTWFSWNTREKQNFSLIYILKQRKPWSLWQQKGFKI